jgi:hypothetical protein
LDPGEPSLTAEKSAVNLPRRRPAFKKRVHSKTEDSHPLGRLDQLLTLGRVPIPGHGELVRLEKSITAED